MLSIIILIVPENIKGFFIITYVTSLFSESIVDLVPSKLFRVLDTQAIFSALVDCWKLSQIAAATGHEMAAGQQAAVYREEAGLYASILGQTAVQAFSKFGCMGCKMY